MPSIPITVFAFGSAFVGTQGASAVLTPLTDLRTNGAVLDESFPTNYEQVLRKDIQSGNHTMQVELDFLSDSSMTTRLSRGLTITASTSAPPNTSLYSLLLIAPDETSSSSYYFPNVRTLRSRKVNYQKGSPTATKITFIAEDRDPNTVLYYQDTVANLISIMGSVSPF